MNSCVLGVLNSQKQPSRGVLRCSASMQQIYRKTPMPKCDFNKVALHIEITLWHGCSLVNLLHISRTAFPKNTSGGLFLNRVLSGYTFIQL